MGLSCILKFGGARFCSETAAAPVLRSLETGGRCRDPWHRSWYCRWEQDDVPGFHVSCLKGAKRRRAGRDLFWHSAASSAGMPLFSFLRLFSDQHAVLLLAERSI